MMGPNYRGMPEGRGRAMLPSVSGSALAPTLFAGPYQYPVGPVARPVAAPSALRQGLATLMRYWKLIGACVVLALLVALLVLAVVEPVYESDALVQVDLKDKSFSKALTDEMSGTTGAPTPVTAEIELLKSRMVLGAVIDEMRLDVVAEPHFVPVVGKWIAKWPPLADVLRKAFGGRAGYAWADEHVDITAAAVPVAMMGRPLTLQIVGPGQYTVSDDGRKLLEGHVGEPARAKSPDGEMVLNVTQLVGEPGTRFDLVVWSRADAIRDLLERYRATEQGKDSGLIRVSYRGEEPQRIAQVLNIAIREYQAQDVSWRTAKAGRTQEFLASQLPALKQKVEAAEGALTRHKLVKEAPDLPVETGLVLQQSVALDQSLFELRQRREELAQRFTDVHPSIMAIDAQIAQANQAHKRVETRIRTLPSSQRELATLTRDLEVNMRLYVAMLDEAQQLGVAKSGTMGVVRVVDSAMVPSLPMFPKPGILLASALIAGLVGGGFLAAFLKATRERIESPADLERAATSRCLASIRKSTRQQGLQRRAARLRGRGEPTHLALASPLDPAIEGLRRLRAAVLTASATENGGVILVAGMTPGAGRGFVLANLGVMLVGSGLSVVLVDVDLERASLQRNFPSPGSGVSEWLRGDVRDLDDMIQTGAAGHPDVVPAGVCSQQPGGSCLTPQRLRPLFSELRERYDYVLINAPPLSAFADGLVLATAVDGVIVVVRHLRSREGQIAALDERLERAGVNVIGTVLNQVVDSDYLGRLGRSALA
jgi:tyrosine-protein kinase Etk/Wzc